MEWNGTKWNGMEWTYQATAAGEHMHMTAIASFVAFLLLFMESLYGRVFRSTFTAFAAAVPINYLT
jgi:hypothetical protein